jgi:hypothetical protein
VTGYTLLHCYTEEPVSGYNVGEYNQPLYTEELVSGYNVGEYNQSLYTEEPVSDYNVGEYNQSRIKWLVILSYIVV